MRYKENVGMYSVFQFFSLENLFMSNKNRNFAADMKKKDQKPMTREQIFAEKAKRSFYNW